MLRHDELRRELASANRILAHEGVLDAFGHVSVRDPRDPGRYLLSRSRAPELVEPDDILAFDLDSQPIGTTDIRLYAERVIHGEIYKARPDVQAVVHHHASAVMPYCITGEALIPVFHLGATMGRRAPFWDSRDEFGDTNLLVVKPEEGASLARALGEHQMVLMRRHGATVVGGNLHELVFRAIYAVRNAEFQTAARAVGTVAPLTRGEIDRAGALNLQSGVVARAWEYWSVRLAKRERAAGAASVRAAPPAKPARAAKTAAKPAKSAKRPAAAKRRPPARKRRRS